MFLGYLLKRKAFKCFNYRTKTIVECANVRIDEKFGTKERIIEYNSDEEPKMTKKSNEQLQKGNNNLQNSAQTKTMREEQSEVPKIRIEVATIIPQNWHLAIIIQF